MTAYYKVPYTALILTAGLATALPIRNDARVVEANVTRDSIDSVVLSSKVGGASSIHYPSREYFLGNANFAQEPSKPRILTKGEESIVDELLSTILKDIDRETRYGCGDKEHPRYFPQHPRLALMYNGGGFSPEAWLRFRRSTRIYAPAVTLVPFNQVTPGNYIIDVTSIQATQPLATATYRHSDFKFGSEFASQPIFGGPGREGPPSIADVLKTSQATFTLSVQTLNNRDDYAWARTLLLGKGNFVRDGGDGREIKDKPEVLKMITEEIERFELSLPERQRMVSGGLHRKEDLKVVAYDRSPSDELNVVRAEMRPGPDWLAGYYREYLLEKKPENWQVRDIDTISFTDVFAIEVCKEP